MGEWCLWCECDLPCLMMRSKRSSTSTSSSATSNKQFLVDASGGEIWQTSTSSIQDSGRDRHRRRRHRRRGCHHAIRTDEWCFQVYIRQYIVQQIEQNQSSLDRRLLQTSGSFPLLIRIPKNKSPAKKKNGETSCHTEANCLLLMCDLLLFLIVCFQTPYSNIFGKPWLLESIL